MSDEKPSRHPNQLAAIAPHAFKPGQSGNPGGRPKRRPISDEYLKICDTIFETDPKKLKIPEGSTFAYAAAFAQFIQAIGKRDTRAMTEIRESIEGKATQRIELSGADDGVPIQIEEKRDLSRLSDSELKTYRDLLRKTDRTHS